MQILQKFIDNFANDQKFIPLKIMIIFGLIVVVGRI